MINGRYKILSKAGAGRSTVYLCEDTLKLDARLAIKILPSSVNAEEKKAFRDEYYLLQRLNHPNIISVFDYGVVISSDEDDQQLKIITGSPFFTLEYFEGVELYESKNLDRENILVDIILQVSSVLYYLHQSAYVYYDLKSENILVREKDNLPVIKFIDFGLTTRVKDIDNVSAKGTSEYIAPEILRKEKIDHRIDLYSLGIMLYKILFGKFPFSVKDQLGIYKAHLNEQFEFPETSYSEKLVEIVRILLSKDSEERFFTSIGIINEIAPAKSKFLRKDWNRIQTFAARRDAFSITSAYIEQENGGEVLTIKGAEGAGKTTLLREINYKYPYSFILSAEQRNDGNIWQPFLRKILYQEKIYFGIDPETRKMVTWLLNGKSTNLVEELKTVIIKLMSAGRFILLIDNFNLISDFDLDIFVQIIPILQVNKIKVVLTEDSSTEYKSKAINSLQVINLNPFTENEVTEFVQNSFAAFYPGEEIKKAVIVYSDLLPGSIEIFLRDLIVLDILKFAVEGPSLSIDRNTDEILKGSQEDIYKFRIDNLDSESKDAAVFLSLFNVNLNIKTIALMMQRSEQDIISTLIRLSEANLIHFNPAVGITQFTSRGIKDYLCSTIEDLKTAHLTAAELVSGNIPDFNKNELARHWEAAEKYELAYETLKDELSRARNASALAYERSLLEHLKSMPLKNESLREVKIALSSCLFNIGEHHASLILMDELLKEPLSEKEEILLKILKGKALISSQNLEEGKKLLESVLINIENAGTRNEILAELAEAEYETAKYEEAEKLSDKLIGNQTASAGIKGKTYRIKGLIELFKNSNPEKTIDCFEKSLSLYKNANMMAKVAAMENNLGNIFNVINNKNKAEEHWNRAIDINNSIGNLLYNGIILLNFGIYYLERCSYEKAVDYYLEAHSIFRTLGDKNNLGITHINLGEVYLILCEYEKAIDVLQMASGIFDSLDNKVEKSEAVFLLGKLYSIVGDIESLEKIIDSVNGYQLNLERTDFISHYLKQLHNLSRNRLSDMEQELTLLRDRSKTFSDNFLFCEIQVTIIEFLISMNRFEDAKKELFQENFIDVCSDHLYYNAYRNFLLGKVIELSKDEKSLPFMEYYEKAYSQISEISITELTWKILFQLYRVYGERGNISRMNEFKNYTLLTIRYIKDQIKSARLKKIYLEKPERRNAIKVLEEN